MKAIRNFKGLWNALLTLLRIRPRTNVYNDPILRDPYTRRHTRKGTKRQSWKQGPPRLGRPPCHPGTITYHDKLVANFGRREADRIGRLIQKGQMDNLPFVS